MWLFLLVTENPTVARDPCVGSLCTEPQGASFLKLKKCFPQTL